MKHRITSALLSLLLVCSLLLPVLPTVADGGDAPLTNIALGQSISSTSTYVPPEGFFNDAYLVDGHWDTYAGGNVKLGWNSSVSNGAGEYDPVDITLSLDATYRVSRIVIKPMQWDKGDATPKAFELQCSFDGKTWTTLVTAKDVNTHAASNTAVVPLTYDIDATEMNYFRIHITRHAKLDPAGAYYSSLGELELYGVQSAAAEEGELSVNKYALCMGAGESDRLFLTNGKRETAHAVTCVSSNPAVVKVEDDGTVQAVADGEATVTLTDTETGETYEVPVTVAHYAAAEKFQIVAFIPFFYEENINETVFDNLKAGGITNVELNFALDANTITYQNNLKTLALAYERGLDVTVSEADFNAGSWPNKTDKQILDFVNRYSHLPGVSGYYVVDEPSNAVPFARAIALIKSVMPNAVAHMNFCGAYDGIVTALQEELGSKYGVSLDYVMYDSYTFRSPTCAENTLYSQLEYNREIGQRLGVNTATYIQSMAWNGCNRPNADAIRYQVYASLAAGVKQISYFCWQTPRANAAETYGPAVIDIDGNPTDLFEPVSKINAAVQALGPTLMKLDCRALYCTGQSFGAGYTELPAGFFIHPADWDQKLAISHMEDKESGRDYSMVVNRDYNAPATVSFTVDEGIRTLYRISDVTGETETLTPVDGVYTVGLAAGEGVLLVCDEDFAFEMKEVTNFYYLEKAVAEAEAVKSEQYREDGREALAAALTEAKALLGDPEAKQAKVDAALLALRRALGALRPTAIEGENLAAGGKVSGSNSYEDGTYFSLSYLTDGQNVGLDQSNHAGWSVDPYSNISRNTPIDLTLDLKKLCEVNALVLQPCIYNRGENTPTDFEIQVSTDGKTFTTVKTVEGLLLKEAIDQYYLFDIVEARYIRIHITKHSPTIDVGTGCALSQIGELEVYGRVADKKTEPTETEPATDPATEPATDPATESVTDPATAPATEPVTEPTTTPMTDPATDTATATTKDEGCSSGIGGSAALLLAGAGAVCVLGGRRRAKKEDDLDLIDS